MREAAGRHARPVEPLFSARRGGFPRDRPRLRCARQRRGTEVRLKMEKQAADRLKGDIMFKRLTAAFLCAAIALPLFFGCSRQGDISSGAGVKDYPVTIGDVTLTSEPAGVAVLSPNIADVILALGYEINLKAKSASCTQSDLAVLPDVTMDDADKLKSLGVTLVFADGKPTDAQKSALDKDGITVLTLKPAASRPDAARLYSEVGAALKGAKTGYDKGQTIAKGLFETIDDITRVIPESDTPIAAVYLSDAGGGAVTGDMLQNALITAAGLTNSASGNTGGKMSQQDLLIANPQYIFCAKGVKAQLLASDEYKKLQAVQKGKVYEMDPAMMQLQGEEMVEAVSFMAGTVYPELLQSTSSSTAAPQSASSASSGTSSAPLNLNQTLKKGMQNADVLAMQNRLQELGYMFMKPTGLFAEGTEQSVKDFQLLNGMPATGIADPATLQKMFSSGAKKRTTTG